MIEFCFDRRMRVNSSEMVKYAISELFFDQKCYMECYFESYIL